MTKIHYEWGANGAIKASQRNDICIVIDVFRASSTIVTALASGFSTVKPVVSFDHKSIHTLTAGEVDSIKIPQCDFGNSPTEILSSPKRASELLLKTSNGSKCLNNISHPNAVVFIGCLLNASKIAKTVATLGSHANKNISIILAGHHGEFCEDDYATGEFISSLIKHTQDCEQNNFIKTKELLLNSKAARSLIDKGYEADVNFCTQLDYYSILPIYDVQTETISIRMMHG